MEKYRVVTIVGTLVLLLFLVSCGAQKKTAQADSRQGTASPFGETFEVPCQMYDTPEEFGATGIYMGSSNQKGECQLGALANARQQVYEKYHHAYKGLVSNYSNTYGNNRGNDIEEKMERAGDMAIDVVLNDIQAFCVRFSGVRDDGMVECYVGIRVPKGELATETAKQVANVLTADEKRQIDFDESKFRQEMEGRQKNFKSNY